VKLVGLFTLVGLVFVVQLGMLVQQRPRVELRLAHGALEGGLLVVLQVLPQLVLVLEVLVMMTEVALELPLLRVNQLVFLQVALLVELLPTAPALKRLLPV